MGKMKMLWEKVLDEKQEKAYNLFIQEQLKGIRNEKESTKSQEAKQSSKRPVDKPSL